jgi:hypothetical protein
MTTRIPELLLLVILLIFVSACSPGAPAAPPTPLPAATAAQLIERFKGAGLEVADVQPIGGTGASFEGVIDSMEFFTPSLCDGCTSMVLVFDSESHALKARTVSEQIGESNDAFKFHHYQKGPLLVRIGGLIEETEANRYKQALE